jgi:hypothetical protein
MIFDGKALSKISNDEISQLVQEHLGERQHLEYKLTIDHKSDSDRFETLCDIASLANAGGGYLIIGIRDDGKGRAQKFESVINHEQIKQVINSLCIDHLAERIDGLEIECRTVDGYNIIIIGIPNSIRIPHMVNYQNSTHFVTRYYDGKREMTIGAIRAAFTDNLFGRKLALIEDGIKGLLGQSNQVDRETLLKQLTNGEISILTISDGAIVSSYSQNAFLEKCEQQPFFYISITPTVTQRNLIDVDAEQIVNILNNPPGQRDAGWNMDFFVSNVQRYAEGLYRGDPKERILKLLQNGHMEFYCLLDTLFCWGQSQEEFEKHPRLNPYPVVEFVCSFLRLYRNIVDILELSNSYIIKMHYTNLKGYTLLPYQPESLGYLRRMSSPHPFNENHLIIPDDIVKNNFDPDRVTYELLKYVYGAYSYKPDMIPFYNLQTETFSFGS